MIIYEGVYSPSYFKSPIDKTGNNNMYPLQGFIYTNIKQLYVPGDSPFIYYNKNNDQKEKFNGKE